MTKRIRLQEAFKLAISMTLMYWLALWMNWDMPKYGGLAILLISLGTAGASLEKGLLRIIGTTVGLAVGFLVLAWLAQDRWLTMLFLSSYLIAIGYFMLGSRYSYAWYVAGFLPLVVWSTTYMKVDTAFHYAIFRYLETTAGIVIYTLVSTLIWPQNAGDKLNQQGQVLWGGFRKLFGFYCRQLWEGELPVKASELQTSLAGTLSQMLTTLEAAYVDTPSVMAQKPVWEVLRVNLRALADALELWRESIDDCRQLDLRRLLPRLSFGLDTLDKRLQRLGDLWQVIQSPEGGLNTDGVAGDLSGLLASDEKSIASAGLSHLQRAALMNFLGQLEALDLVSYELLRTLRVLAGLDSDRGFRLQSWQRDLFRPSRWVPERLIKALFPGICFVTAYIFWIYTDPPTGPTIPKMAAIMGLAFVLTPFNPLALLVALMVSMCVVVAPVYCLVMPWLNGFGLLVLIFVYTFVFGYLGGRSPIMKLGPILLFVTMTGISNQQSYSFIGLVNGGILWVLALSIIAVMNMLLIPIRPEKRLLHNVRRFFHGCARVIGGFALYRPKDQAKGQKLRKRYYESMILPVPQQLQEVEKTLDYRLFPDNNPEKVRRLLDVLESISLRLQALEIAHIRVVNYFPDMMEPLSPLRDKLRKRLQRVFETWARFEQTDALEDERFSLQQVSLDLEKRLDAHAKVGEQSLIDGQVSEEFYALLGSIRGLIEAMAETRKVLRQINWGQWAEARF